MDKYTETDGTTLVQAHIVCENVEFLTEKPAEKPAEKPTDSDFVEMPF